MSIKLCLGIISGRICPDELDCDQLASLGILYQDGLTSNEIKCIAEDELIDLFKEFKVRRRDD